MKIFENFSLKNHNTFHLDVYAKKCVILENTDELKTLDQIIGNDKFLILGGGSNVLFVNDFDGVIIKNEIKGKEIIDENDEYVNVKIKSGEVWHEMVMWSVKNNWNGIENLALIPGTVGAAPVQNIGAYGVEVKDVLQNVSIYNFETKKIEVLNNDQCKFSYRNSIFKNELKGKFFILEIVLQLRKKNHIYHTSYGTINTELEKRNIKEINPQIIAEIVMDIRKSKLPDPEKIGNAGSFFKNPEVSKNKYHELKNRYSDIVAYPVENGNYKLAAGWMIEHCGLKGYEYKGAAVHDKQALVLVNKNNASGKDILELAKIIIQKVFDKFAVKLEPEVNIIS
ncbi:MAG TPA: UDP-N-acetylmuramate dehydrogenase [Bacteroidia bacterium]|nr:UDP-N-acetylmuramate dehydrogenase [Bacteroidia bacterium]